MGDFRLENYTIWPKFHDIPITCHQSFLENDKILLLSNSLGVDSEKCIFLAMLHGKAGEIPKKNIVFKI